MRSSIYQAIALALSLYISLNPASGSQASTPPNNRFQEIMSLNRARHIARAAGERINGGVERYRAEPAMHQTIGDNHVQDKGTYWLISFLGGTPEEVSIQRRYSIYTVVKINKTTFQSEVLYNGHIPEDIKRKRGLYE